MLVMFMLGLHPQGRQAQAANWQLELELISPHDFASLIDQALPAMPIPAWGAPKRFASRCAS
jgi:hypothetical protein